MVVRIKVCDAVQGVAENLKNVFDVTMEALPNSGAHMSLWGKTHPVVYHVLGVTYHAYAYRAGASGSDKIAATIRCVATEGTE